jgi:hypothetical protein
MNISLDFKPESAAGRPSARTEDKPLRGPERRSPLSPSDFPRFAGLHRNDTVGIEAGASQVYFP